MRRQVLQGHRRQAGRARARARLDGGGWRSEDGVGGGDDAHRARLVVVPRARAPKARSARTAVLAVRDERRLGARRRRAVLDAEPVRLARGRVRVRIRERVGRREAVALGRRARPVLQRADARLRAACCARS